MGIQCIKSCICWWKVVFDTLLDEKLINFCVHKLKL